MRKACSSADVRLTQQLVVPAQDALDAIEFISGPPGGEWGAQRTRMGRVEPWRLAYIAVGNEVRTNSHHGSRPAANAHQTRARMSTCYAAPLHACVASCSLCLPHVLVV